MSFDPETIIITRHALERYRQRRGGGGGEPQLRRLLARCAHQTPPIIHRPPHEPARIYQHARYKFVTTANSDKLITFMEGGGAEHRRAVDRNRDIRAARRARRCRNGN